MLEAEPTPLPLQPSDTPFAGVEGRGSVDYLLRNVHQQLVQLSVQADMKASVMITATSIVLSLSFAVGQPSEPRPSLIVLAVGIGISMAFAIFTLLPKISLGRRGATPPVAARSPDLLFFGDFAQMQRDRYAAEMARVARSDASVYQTIVENLHNQGVYLQRHKYRYLRLCYTCFLATVALAGLVELVGWAAG